MRKTIFLLTLLFSFSSFASNWLDKTVEDREGFRASKEEAQQEKASLFFQEHGLIFFYSSLCPHCQAFAPVIKSFSDKEKAAVLPLSFDNQAISGFPRYQEASTEWVNIAYQGRAIEYPALFIVNPKTKALYPVSFGSMSIDELNARMRALIPKIENHERKENA